MSLNHPVQLEVQNLNVVFPFCFILRYLIDIEFSQKTIKYQLRLQRHVSTRRSRHQAMFRTTNVYKAIVHILGSQKAYRFVI